MDFYERIRNSPSLRMFGRGFTPIEDKWDGLAPFKYSISYENFSNSHYWTEKVMDCFLAWTMPVYYGCTELENFFPRESFIRLDPAWKNPQERLSEILSSGLWEKNLAAIAEARRRVLDHYNLFEFAAREISAEEHRQPARLKRRHRIAVRNHVIPIHRKLYYRAWGLCRSAKRALSRVAERAL
jgi:hypothetical protein